jgi:hypothetical protein
MEVTCKNSTTSQAEAEVTKLQTKVKSSGGRHVLSSLTLSTNSVCPVYLLCSARSASERQGFPQVVHTI